jgi:hypothetical protein
MFVWTLSSRIVKTSSNQIITEYKTRKLGGARGVPPRDYFITAEADNQLSFKVLGF